MGNITAIHDQYYKYDEGGEYVSSSLFSTFDNSIWGGIVRL